MMPPVSNGMKSSLPGIRNRRPVARRTLTWNFIQATVEITRPHEWNDNRKIAELHGESSSSQALSRLNPSLVFTAPASRPRPKTVSVRLTAP
jgi:hypothetical protein